MSASATVNMDTIAARLDALSVSILDLLDVAKALSADLTETVTDEAFAAKLLVMGQPEVPIENDPATGQLINRGRPEGWLGPLTQAQYDKWKARIAVLDRFIKALDVPTGTGTNAKSLAQILRAGGVRFRR